jgi:hypothetical protein
VSKNVWQRPYLRKHYRPQVASRRYEHPNHVRRGLAPFNAPRCSQSAPPRLATHSKDVHGTDGRSQRRSSRRSQTRTRSGAGWLRFRPRVAWPIQDVSKTPGRLARTAISGAEARTGAGPPAKQAQIPSGCTSTPPAPESAAHGTGPAPTSVRRGRLMSLLINSGGGGRETPPVARVLDSVPTLTAKPTGEYDTPHTGDCHRRCCVKPSRDLDAADFSRRG